MFFTQVEGERLLLVATHKRAAALNEISRLKTAGEKFLSNIQYSFLYTNIAGSYVDVPNSY
jgi:hypothetical protein